MKKNKVVFMGTPDFAVPTLQMLIEQQYSIELVVTQPDRPKGRGNKHTMSAVKEVALKHNLHISQPDKIRGNEEFYNEISSINPEIIIVVAFGQILPKEILDLPILGCINIHGSLLPKYRGAAPIQWAIIDGEDETGVTIMYMNEGLDTGDMIYKKTIKIEHADTSATLFDKLSNVGATALQEALPMILDGGKDRVTQDDSIATLAPRINKELGHIDFTKPATAIYNLMRGLIPWPVAYFIYQDTPIKVFDSTVINHDSDKLAGTIVKVDKEGILVQCASGMLLITDIQVPNKKRMKVSEYIKGHQIDVGVII
ncbi:MAG: methionyl-tRNA formyltransferase [Epulopiscium sp. Nuni2H_MBin001]|nr:MAG: methionyl-tRNA formyltransferase [Epulopiscium sp. Nuni2H_MBin001]